MSLARDIMITLDTRKENHLDVRLYIFKWSFNSGVSLRNIQEYTMQKAKVSESLLLKIHEIEDIAYLQWW